MERSLMIDPLHISLRILWFPFNILPYIPISCLAILFTGLLVVMIM
jgi:hypothetical protein